MSILDQSVIDLHNIARIIEKEIGTSKLSLDCRKLADRLSAFIKPTSENKSTAKGDQ